MLKEDDVNRFTQSYLLSKGYEIVDSHLTTSKGPDILAKNDVAVLEIECKGSCSPTTGQPFNKNHDTYSRVTQGVFNLVKSVELNKDLDHPS